MGGGWIEVCSLIASQYRRVGGAKVMLPPPLPPQIIGGAWPPLFLRLRAKLLSLNLQLFFAEGFLVQIIPARFF